MELISNMLFWLSNGMLIPDIIFLLFFFIKALLMIGGFYGTYIARTKINVKLNREIGKTGVEEFLYTLPAGNGKSKLLEYLRKIKAAPQDRALREKRLGDYEIAADKELGQSKLLVKIGPMLGLMGTLIPMGPALVGLATGDIGSMAHNTPGGFAQMQPAEWPEGIDTMVRFKDALSCEFREAQGLHFYSDDYQFERVWAKPEVYLELLEQFAFVVEPDFSMYLDFPEPLQKWNHYRNQLLGAWWQARGLTVIPSASWADAASFAWTFEGLPEHSTVAISTVGCVKGRELYGYFMAGVHELFRQKQPTGLLVYGKLTPDIEQVCKDAGIKYKNFPHTMMGARFLTKKFAGKLAQEDKRNG